MNTVRLGVNGIDLACLEAGDARRSAILLHGFPDDAGTMEDLMGRLVRAGYRCRAP
jgi:pimeloyl-ACP methyl ester carboxylesterase